MAKKRFLGEMLLSGGFINDEELAEVLELQRTTGARMGDVLIDKGFVTEQELMLVLENQQNVPYVDLDRADPDQSLIKLVPQGIAKRNVIVPVKVENNVLYVAMEDPKNFPAIDDVRHSSKMDVQPMLSRGRSIMDFMQKLYGNTESEKAVDDFVSDFDTTEIASALNISDSAEVDNAPIVRLINSLMEQAVRMGASDVHVEPGENDVRVRMRVDGALQIVLSTPRGAAAPLSTRLKIMGNLNIAEKRVPQDGRFKLNIANREIDVRLSLLPTVYGEKAVMRLLDRTNFLKPKDTLGFTPQNLRKFDDLLATPHGIILVTGPTGSGKSTTLYTMLSEINNEKDNIITVEDPVEYMIGGLNQVQVNAKAGLDFSAGLRSILRQDPDIIMIGEMRDNETVDIAVRAAITGHLVLSTIHTNDAVSTIFRLVDMGVPEYMVSASVVGIISQRLVRTICGNCKTTYVPTESDLFLAGISQGEADTHTFYHGAGCPTCNGTGYKGRMAVHEVLILEPGFRDLVQRKATTIELYDYAIAHGMVPMKDAAKEAMYNGRTTIDEMIHITHGT